MKWEHKAILFSDGGETDTLEKLGQRMTDKLTTMGAEGWEAIGITDHGGPGCTVILKRRLPSDER